jgi:hypothetical protein
MVNGQHYTPAALTLEKALLVSTEQDVRMAPGSFRMFWRNIRGEQNCSPYFGYCTDRDMPAPRI